MSHALRPHLKIRRVLYDDVEKHQKIFQSGQQCHQPTHFQRTILFKEA